MLTKRRQITAEEQRLRAERDEAQQVLYKKQKALDEYRDKEESGLLSDLREMYVGKIIRVRQYERGLSPMNKYERQYHYMWIHVRDVKHKWRDETGFSGEKLEINLQPSNFDLADHLGDKEFTKVEMCCVLSDQLRVSDEDIDDKFWTEEEVREVAKRTNEVENELLKVFFEGAEDEG
jgi:hypothetical protein